MANHKVLGRKLGKALVNGMYAHSNFTLEGEDVLEAVVVRDELVPARFDPDFGVIAGIEVLHQPLVGFRCRRRSIGWIGNLVLEFLCCLGEGLALFGIIILLRELEVPREGLFNDGLGGRCVLAPSFRGTWKVSSMSTCLCLSSA